ncbi:MAG: hypothetical protein H7329_19745 [Opitutaceae bacterium]|nr:hypothetical protein [Cytophagales bacterium]
MKRSTIFIFKLFSWIFLFLISLLIISYSVASVYKKDILAYFNTEIDNGIAGSAHLDNISFTIFREFPSVSVTLIGLTIKDSVYNNEVIKAEKVYLQIHLLKLLKKELDVKSIILQNANFNIFKDSLGYSNLSVFSRKTLKSDTTRSVKSSLMDFNLKKIIFKKVSLVYLDDKKKKRIQLACNDILISVKKSDKEMTCHINGQIFSEGLLFNNLKGPFLQNKELQLSLNLTYNQADSLLTLLPSTISTQGQLYEVSGKSRLNQKLPLIYLDINTSNTDYSKAISLLNTHLQKVLNQFHVDQGLNAQVHLVLDTKPGVQPFAKVNFQIDNSRVRLIDYFLDNVKLNGEFNNHIDTLQLSSDENSILNINSSDFYYKEINFKVVGNLQNLNVPETNINAVVSGPLKAFHHYLDTAVYKFSNGTFSFNLAQKGPISLKNIPDPIMMKGYINAGLKINDGKMDIVKKQLVLSDINGDLNFLNTNVNVKDLSCKINDNQVHIGGELNNMVSYLLFPENNIKAKLNITSPYFNLNKLLVKSEHKKLDSKKNASKPFMGHLHKIMSKMEMDFDVYLKQFEYKKLITNEIKGNVGISNDAISLNNWKLSMPTKGIITMNGAYIFQDNDSGKVKIEANLKNIDASKLFYGFNNFGQNSLTNENLAGLIDAKVNINCQTNRSFEPIQRTIKGKMSMLLTQGQLKNFEPLKKVGDLVFKNRDMMHIHFDEINNIFVLEGEELYIEKMVVSSTVLSLYLEGIFSFKHKTDLSIQIPLSNLKDQNSEYVKIKDIQHGNLRLRAREKDGKMNIALDLFDRYHKN